MGFRARSLVLFVLAVLVGPFAVGGLVGLWLAYNYWPPEIEPVGEVRLEAWPEGGMQTPVPVAGDGSEEPGGEIERRVGRAAVEGRGPGVVCVLSSGAVRNVNAYEIRRRELGSGDEARDWPVHR